MQARGWRPCFDDWLLAVARKPDLRPAKRDRGTGPPRKTADRDSSPPSWPLVKPGGGTRGVTSTLTPTDLPLRPGHGDHLEVAVAALGEGEGALAPVVAAVAGRSPRVGALALVGEVVAQAHDGLRGRVLQHLGVDDRVHLRGRAVGAVLDRALVVVADDALLQAKVAGERRTLEPARGEGQ